MEIMCEYCNEKLPTGFNNKWKWVCPECGHTNFDHPAWMNCENCHYQPKYAPCPFCNKTIDLMALFFNNFYTN